jgi:hypothetical protein
VSDNETFMERIVRRLRIPDQPSPGHRDRLWQRMVEVFGQAKRRHERKGAAARAWSSFWVPRGGFRSRSSRLAVLVVVAGVLAGLVLLVAYLTASLSAWFKPAGSPAGVTWPEVLERAHVARSVSCTVTYQAGEAPAQEFQVRFRRPGGYRINGPDTLLIVDHVHGKVLAATRATKQYRIMRLSDLPEANRLVDLFDYLSGLPPLAGRHAGSQLAGEGKVEVFRASDGNRQWTFCIDPATAEPTRIQIESPSAGEQWVLTDLNWHAEGDEELFKLSPPEGYKEIDN